MKNFDEVIVYSSTTWPPCKQMKEFLSMHSIVFKEKLIDQDGCPVVFGGWTSASRKAMLPVFERKDALC